MESIGERLRKAREEKFLSREDVAEATKISAKRLEDLEHDRFPLLPPPVFVKGFIRAYCRFVDLDEQELLRAYAEIVKTKGFGEPGLKEGVKGKSRRGTFVVLVLVLLGVVIAVAHSRLSSPPLQEKASAPAVPAPAVRENDSPPAPPQVEVTTKEEEPAPPLPSQPIRMEMTCRSTTWLEVTIDNGLPSEVTLVPGDEISWEGKERIELKLGNAGGVGIEVNDMALRAFGKAEEVVGLVFEQGTVSVKGKPAQRLAEWQLPGEQSNSRQGE